MSSPKHQLCFMLHAHLPWADQHCPEGHWPRAWFSQSVIECYLPLLQMLEDLVERKVAFRLAMSFSASLTHMLQSTQMQEECYKHLQALQDACQSISTQSSYPEQMRSLAYQDLQRFRMLHKDFQARQGDLIRGFKALRESGHLELCTTAYSHAYLPLWRHNGSFVKAQVDLAVKEHQRVWQEKPQGFWLPECAYEPFIEPYLQEAGVSYSFLEAHGLLEANPSAEFAVFAPAKSPQGFVYLARDLKLAEDVWSPSVGYPKNPYYREFHWDLGLKTGEPFPLGLKFQRVSDPGQAKQFYEHLPAEQEVLKDAKRFIAARRQSADCFEQLAGQKALIVAPFDAELFGHWWHEGLPWLKQVLEQCAEPQSDLQLCLPSSAIKQAQSFSHCRPSPSSWGDQGYHQVWLNPQNAWVYDQLSQLLEQFQAYMQPKPQISPEQEPWLVQLAHELLLASASDWPFLIEKGSFEDYVQTRLKQQLEFCVNSLKFLKGHDMIDPHVLKQHQAERPPSAQLTMERIYEYFTEQ